MTERRYWILLFVLIGVWLAAVARLTIADVWDETNGLVVFADGSYAAITKTVLMRSVGFWRPIPTLFAALVIRALDAEVAWRLLRALNALLLLVALGRLLRTLDAWAGRDLPRNLLFAAAYLYSAGAIIAATWFANLFDVWSLVLIACGLELLRREKCVAAGVVFGAGFFCKETTALVFPMLLMLVALGRIRFRDALRAGIPAAIFGAVYFALRNRLIPFGSAADTHGFALADFLPTLHGVLDGWWRQTFMGSGPTLFGVACFVLSLLGFRTWRARAACLVLAFGTAVIYWQMTTVYAKGTLLHYVMFYGRLFLIPSTVTLFALALERRRWITGALLLPLLLAAITTYMQYERFQRSYRNLYRAAAASPKKPFIVSFPMKPLHDPRRGIEIGDDPSADWTLDPKNGKLYPVAR